MSNLCNKSAGQLNALCRIGHFVGLGERKKLITSFIYANFNYCPLVWHFSSKLENIQKRASRFLLNDYSSDYETLLKKTKKCTMEVKWLKLLPLEIFKAFNKNGPTFIKDYYEKNETLVSK